jgi:5-methylcytosine-specific restriction endonuclease McrA
MAITPKMRKLIQARDEYCWHCGETEDLVIHHRKNKGQGGSKLLDVPDNLMMVCPVYNMMMESDALTARDARGWGRKIAFWETTDKPVFDSVRMRWYRLDSQGGKEEIVFRDSEWD